MAKKKTKKARLGRPPKAVKEINPQAQFGRHPQEEIDLIDAAADAANQTRSAWAWPRLLRAARQQLSTKEASGN